MSIYRVENTVIGQGAFSDIRLAKNNNDKIYAVKRCKLDAGSIKNLMEVNIMASIRHPHLAHSVDTMMSDKNVYIFQDLAKGDLASICRKERPTLEMAKKWFYSIASALACLHQEHIVHGDIKGNNILYFPNGVVKLADFTLSRYIYEGVIYKNDICTCTHRPPECLTRQSWSYSADIWALGCTFYELFYGELLFPMQDRMDKEANRNKMLKCIQDWCGYDCGGARDYKRVRISEHYRNKDNIILNDLIASMIVFDPTKRLTIKEVLAHQFFDVKYEIHYELISTKALYSQNVDLTEYNLDEKVGNIVARLYPRIYPQNKLTQRDMIYGLVRIAQKLIDGRISETLSGLYVDVENEILHLLDFKLHV